MRPRPRPRITFPQGTVEAFEPANFERVTSIRSQMEVDFWKHIQMPLKSGLAAEVRFCIFSSFSLTLMMSEFYYFKMDFFLGFLPSSIIQILLNIMNIGWLEKNWDLRNKKFRIIKIRFKRWWDLKFFLDITSKLVQLKWIEKAPPTASELTAIII